MNSQDIASRIAKLFRIRTALFGLALAALLTPRSGVAATARLSDWIGQGNTEGANDYNVISSNSAGGTFQSRMSPPPPSGTFPETWYLRDASLAGGPLGFDDSLSMSGKITINNPNNTDPSWFFGWYSSTDYRYRLGFSAAQAVVIPVPPVPPNAFRMQIALSDGNALTSFPLTSDGSSSSLKAVTPAGTYDFSFTYSPGASNNLTAHIQSATTDWRRENLTANESAAKVFDRFGFLQVGATANVDPKKSTDPFEVIVSDLHYTGETIPEPSSLLLAAMSTFWLLGVTAARPRMRAKRDRPSLMNRLWQ